MESETVAKLFEHGDIMDAVHVDPGDGGFIFVGEAGFGRGKFRLLEIALVVIDDVYLDRLMYFIPGIYQGLGREACLLGTFFCKFMHRRY
jgi:hypothetical protein